MDFFSILINENLITIEVLSHFVLIKKQKCNI